MTLTIIDQISLFPQAAKIVEFILHKRIYTLLKHCISIDGFVEGRSVMTNLMTFIDFVSAVLDKSSQVDVVYTDFQKASDKVDQSILLRKLNNFGLSNGLLKLFEGYLQHREQHV